MKQDERSSRDAFAVPVGTAVLDMAFVLDVALLIDGDVEPSKPDFVSV
ncbi:hypothetical protein OZX74_00975 [Bifidobacterium sp. ESL0798]|nr:hypothetical protein [Bifidobacterium sp. ESL0798]WEV74171.1 hypothetical protein OZX74_00975 [Bifidobacterium sp. ESL0798]